MIICFVFQNIIYYKGFHFRKENTTNILLHITLCSWKYLRKLKPFIKQTNDPHTKWGRNDDLFYEQKDFIVKLPHLNTQTCTHLGK